MVNESCVLNTGYSIYGKEVLSRLYESGKYEIAEFAMYIKKDDPRIQNIPWKVYTNLPESEQEKQFYEKSIVNEFGAYKFEQVCLDFKPHIVFDIRDVWMFTFETLSPLRKYYNLAVMPTVDSEPQMEQWLETYENADAIFTYTDWSAEVLNKQSNGKLKVRNIAPPSVNKEMFPASYEDKQKIKASLGLSNKNIIGTVMRNQKRKLFPDLFKAFKEFIEENEDKNTYLHCHTSFPDLGWDIPQLLLKNGISSRVYFTYKCKKCANVAPMLFSDAIAICDKCKEKACTLVNVQNGVDNKTLNLIYNSFDLYIQISTNEGFGMPLLEAAKCGVPCMASDYSAMSSIIRKVDGFPIPNLHMILESESGAYKSIPCTEEIKKYWHYFFYDLDENDRREKRRKTVKNTNDNFGSWSDTANIWMDYFDSVDIKKYEDLWKSKPEIKQSSIKIPSNCNNSEYVRWLITDVLCDKTKIGSNFEARMLRDLNYGASIGGYGEDSASENSFVNSRRKITEFNREIAYNNIRSYRENINNWEYKRGLTL